MATSVLIKFHKVPIMFAPRAVLRSFALQIITPSVQFPNGHPERCDFVPFAREWPENVAGDSDDRLFRMNS